MKYPEIAKQIIALKNADLMLRDKLIESGKLFQGYHIKMETLHIENANALDELIQQIGYPTVDSVGREASDAAWLIVQHSISLPTFMKKCLSLLKKTIEQDKGNPINLAYLADRIAVLEGKPQLYGTQFDWDETGNLSPQRYDDLDTVNQRRKSIGLNTVEQQTQLLRERAIKEKESAPKNLQERKLKLDTWKKSVGWIK